MLIFWVFYLLFWGRLRVGGKHSLAYSLKVLDITLEVIVTWVTTNILNVIARRIKAMINTSDGKTLKKVIDVDARILAFGFSVDPAEVKFCIQRNKKELGYFKGALNGFKELIFYYFNNENSTP